MKNQPLTRTEVADYLSEYFKAEAQIFGSSRPILMAKLIADCEGKTQNEILGLLDTHLDDYIGPS
jgi:hypothetical protein